MLELLPEDFSLYEILPYLEKIIEDGECQKRQNMVLRSLLKSEKLVVSRYCCQIRYVRCPSSQRMV